jgi:hypothetical protein
LADPNVIGVKGFVYDTVESIGDTFHMVDSSNKQGDVLRQWKMFIESSLAYPDNRKGKLLNEAVTAGKSTA